MHKRIYLVGGAIRDRLMNIVPTDKDYVAIGWTAAEFEAIGYKRIGSSFPVFLDSHTGYEYALARTEHSTGSGTLDFTTDTSGVSIEQDLLRRDITINAMAMGSDDVLIDPYNGQADITNKFLRHTSPAFVEDPVRVLRLARFRTKFPTFRIHKSTKVLVYSMRHQLLALQPERVWKEVSKALALPNSYLFFESLFELGVLDVVFPHLFQLTILKEGSKYHMEASVFEHTMQVLREVSGQPVELQLAALFHDISKPLCYREYGDSSGHELHPSIPTLIRSTLALPNSVYKDVLFLVNNHARIYKLPVMKASSIGKYLYSYRGKRQLLYNQLILAHADDLGRINRSVTKQINDDAILSAFAEIDYYSPAEWIGLQPKPTTELIIQHIVVTNATIARKYLKD